MKVKIEKKKGTEGIVDTFLKGVSYGTGVLARKAADIGKVGETKPWKEVASKTGDLYKKANTNTVVILKKAKKTVKESIRDMKKSFKEGVDSATDETTKSKTISTSSAPEQPLADEETFSPVKIKIDKEASVLRSQKSMEQDSLPQKAKREGKANKKEGGPKIHILLCEVENATEVKAAGSFNQWQPQKMEKNEKGKWFLPLKLPMGKYSYKLIIDGKWQKDAGNPKSAPDGFGGENSILEVA